MLCVALQWCMVYVCWEKHGIRISVKVDDRRQVRRGREAAVNRRPKSLCQLVHRHLEILAC